MTNKASGAIAIPGAGCHELTTDGATLWLAGGCIGLVAAPRKIWKLDTRREKVTATIEPGGDVGAPVIWRDQLWMLTSLHLVSIDEETNRVVERAAIQGPGGAAVADGTLWVTNRSASLGFAWPDKRIGAGVTTLCHFGTLGETVRCTD